MKNTIEKISETKSWFFAKINKIGKPLARLFNKKRGHKKIQSEMKERLLQTIKHEQLCNLGEMDKLLYIQFLNIPSSNTESGRNRKYEQTNHKH